MASWTGERNAARIEGHIYVHTNDPSVVRRGANVVDVPQAQGGFLPLLNSQPRRRHENASYEYNARVHHGTRPMHKSTLTLAHQPSLDNHFSTQSESSFRGYQLRPEYIQYRADDQFKRHFDIGDYSPSRSLTSSYASEFYNKINDKQYVENFDLMPKYSVGKQINQLEKEGKPRVYANRDSRIREALEHSQLEPDYWTQYNRIHGVLGSARGIGVSRDYPSRSAYNIFTGERLDKPSWTMDGNYKLVSRYRRDFSSGNNFLD